MENNIVYMHINKINGKKYIGQTSNLAKRWRPSSYISCPYFYHAIQKYGWNNFEHVIIKEHLAQEEADILEEELIKKYNTTNNECGYNLANGGNKKCALVGEHNGFYGKRHTEDSLKIMKEKKYGGNNPIAKAVVCITTGEVFPSCREASDWCGVSKQNIQRCARGGRPTAGKHPDTGEKLKWRYVEDEI